MINSIMLELNKLYPYSGIEIETYVRNNQVFLEKILEKYLGNQRKIKDLSIHKKQDLRRSIYILTLTDDSSLILKLCFKNPTVFLREKEGLAYVNSHQIPAPLLIAAEPYFCKELPIPFLVIENISGWTLQELLINEIDYPARNQKFAGSSLLKFFFNQCISLLYQFHYSDTNHNKDTFYNDHKIQKIMLDYKVMLRKTGRNNEDYYQYLDLIYDFYLQNQKSFDLNHLSPLHGDLALSNLMYTGDKLVFIDLENFYRGDSAKDIANFLERFPFDKGLREKWITEVIHMYRQSDTGFEVRLKFYIALQKLWNLINEKNTKRADDFFNYVDRTIVASKRKPVPLIKGVLEMDKNARRQEFNEQIIWLNPESKVWIRLTKDADLFVQNCLKKTYQSCIEEYQKKYNSDVRGYYNLIEYLIQGKILIEKQATCHFSRRVEEKKQKIQPDKIILFERNSEAHNFIPVDEYLNFFKQFDASHSSRLNIILTPPIDRERMQILLKQAGNHFKKIILSFNASETKITDILTLLPYANAFEITFNYHEFNEMQTWEVLFKEVVSCLLKYSLNIALLHPLGITPKWDLTRTLSLCKTMHIQFMYDFCNFFDEVDNVHNLDPEINLYSWLSFINGPFKDNFRPHEWGRYYLLAPKSHCNARHKYLVVAGTGDVFSCPRLMTTEYKAANILEHTFREICDRLASNRIFRSVDEKTTCNECHTIYFCGGGCSARILKTFNEIDKKDPLCSFIQKGPGMIPWFFDSDLADGKNIEQMMEVCFHEYKNSL